jgi:hypothetical protein
MRDYFADSLKTVNRLYGSIDDKKQEYNISLDYEDYNKYNARIIGSNKPPWPTDPLTATIVVSIDHINDFKVGDLIKGAGISVGSTIVSITTITDPFHGTNLHILLSKIAGPMLLIPWSVYINPTITWDTVITVLRPTSLKNTTISFSEITKGWTSFKSWIQEDGVSLNSEFYTFKKGNLWKHHFDSVDRNNFYGEPYDSSVELLFNELPGSVKSFQTLNYEGSQSKITPPINPDTGEVVDGEYWDNELKEGWYISQMYTDMQQADNHEFKEKEGKWFSQIQGVATEWLNDGTAGNIDTNEFSYQGIDESEAISIIDGGYTSWDCQFNSSTPCCADGNDVNLPTHPTAQFVVSSSSFTTTNPIISQIGPAIYTQFYNWFWNNPSVNFRDWNYLVIDTDTSHPRETWLVNGCFSGGVAVNDSSIYPNNSSNWVGIEQAMIINSTNPVYSWLEIYSGSTAQTPTGNPGFATMGGKNANEIVQAFIDHVDSTAYYLGMSHSAWQGAMGSFTAAGFPLNTPNVCLELNTYSCQEIEGLGGAYATESLCLSDVGTPCGPTTESWNCIVTGGGLEGPSTASCIDPGDGSGNYADEVTCILDCSPCEDPVVSIITQNAWRMPGDEFCSDPNGGIEISVNSLGATWGYLITNAITNIDVYSDSGFASGTSTTYNSLYPGTYDLTITDSLGCIIIRSFIIECVVIDPGCAVGPYSTMLGPATSPHNIQYLYNPATNAACDNGSLQLNIGIIGGGASSIDRVELFDNSTTPPTSINIDNNSYSAISITPLIQNLTSGVYMFEVTDDLGCVYYYGSFLPCHGPTVKCSGPHPFVFNGVLIPPYTCLDPLDGTGPYTTLTAFNNGFLDSTGTGDPFAECIASPCVDCPNDNPFAITSIIVDATCGMFTSPGSITVQLGTPPVYASYVPPPTTWTIEYFDASGVLLITDPNTYNVVGGAQATTQDLNDGSYYFTITDNNGCFWSRWFAITCNVPPSWDCGAAGCYDPGNGLGVYFTQNACQIACVDPVSIPCEDISNLGDWISMSVPGPNVGAVLKWRIEVGAATGACKLDMAPYFANMAPKRLTWKYDGVSRDEWSFSQSGFAQTFPSCSSLGTCGYQKGFYGTTGASQCTPAITNSSGSSGISYTVPEYNYDHSLNTSFPGSASTSSMIASGNNVTIGPIPSSEVDLVVGGPNSFDAIGIMVIPKPNASPSFIDFELEIPCDDPAATTFLQDQIFIGFERLCPEPLREFNSSGIGGTCGIYDRKIYVAKVNRWSGGEMTAHETDWVFWDENGVNKVADGTYYVEDQNPSPPNTISSPNTRITVQNSVITGYFGC